jgi:hypothetical protein
MNAKTLEEQGALVEEVVHEIDLSGIKVAPQIEEMRDSIAERWAGQEREMYFSMQPPAPRHEQMGYTNTEGWRMDSRPSHFDYNDPLNPAGAVNDYHLEIRLSPEQVVDMAIAAQSVLAKGLGGNGADYLTFHVFLPGRLMNAEHGGPVAPPCTAHRNARTARSYGRRPGPIEARYNRMRQMSMSQAQNLGPIFDVES